jgi:hypothetical protein
MAKTARSCRSPTLRIVRRGNSTTQSGSESAVIDFEPEWLISQLR